MKRHIYHCKSWEQRSGLITGEASHGF